jgi:hypothetical protein
VAYVHDLRPSLNISKTTTNAALISWPAPWNGWALQQITNLHTTNWESPQEPVNDDGAMKSIVVNPPAGSRFYRLIKP